MLLIQYVFVLHGKLSGPAGYVKINAGENSLFYSLRFYPSKSTHASFLFHLMCMLHSGPLKPLIFTRWEEILLKLCSR